MEFASAVLYVDDGTVPAVLDFYEQVLGWRRRFYDPDYQFGELAGPGPTTLAVAAHATGVRLMPDGYRPPAVGAPVAGTELAFTTTDVAGAFARALGAGASALAPPAVLPWGQAAAYVRAPDGTILGLCAPLPAGPAPDATASADA